MAADPAAPAAPDPQEEDDIENLMSALGQESEKVERLKELLQERGFDPTSILNEVCPTLCKTVCTLNKQTPGCFGKL